VIGANAERPATLSLPSEDGAEEDAEESAEESWIDGESES